MEVAKLADNSIKEEEFSKVIEDVEARWGITDLIYQACIAEFSKIDLKDLNDLYRERILVAFLLVWGVMQRHLGYSGLEAVYEKLKDAQFSAKLAPFRTLNIENADNLKALKTQITELFNDMAMTSFSSNKGKPKRAGPTTASKILHLCCPNFFIMWDVDIRKKFNKNGDGNDYFLFLVEMQERMRQLQPTLRQLEQKYAPKTATTFIDKYNWVLAHPEKEQNWV